MDKKHQPDSRVKLLLQRYLRREATPEEKAVVDHWFNSLEDNTTSFSGDRESLRKSILAGITARTAPAEKGIRVSYRQAFRYAAMLIILIGTGIGMFVKYGRSKAPLELHTGRGETLTSQLPDGSTVTLNAMSSLVIPADFARSERKVLLSGEAFFDVTADPAHPFRVSDSSMTTTVLGTSFNIRAYAGESTRKVAVVSGRVKVETPGNSFTLQHHEILQYQPLSGKAWQSHADTAGMRDWQDAVLDFDHFTIAEMMAALERHYPVHIVLHSRPADTTVYNIRFHKESVENILGVLKGLTGITVHPLNGQLIIDTKTYAQQMK
ncbi:FecR family protein [Chitinophaga arvensicola]|uniref:Ferric-dicitrate binding protein FerR, regulates iron transport through sigma-19 n=1 Tax=Chitinophaga arvensicola TaxID=29529 RepID=A0A1I0RRU8_9BACT|nr:FecR domain-containing protein [Chitinophaga arvensicola]SEW43982.1 ferric-dicitrate binding protein FerR, regulates iron transport through sigma-19 [Chitinophaga arvensicola]